MFAVNDSGSSMHLVDRDGRVILTLKSKFFSAHNKWYIYSGRGTDKENKIATVKPQSGTTSAEVRLSVITCCAQFMLLCMFIACHATQLLSHAVGLLLLFQLPHQYGISVVKFFSVFFLLRACLSADSLHKCRHTQA